MVVLTENQKTWVEALRSGEYRQVRSQLRTIDGYCCLGVACDISKQGRWDEADPETYRTFNGYEAHDSLPIGVSNWLIGIERDDIGHLDMPILIGTDRNSIPTTCAELNDVCHLTFPQIADMVEYFGFRNA